MQNKRVFLIDDEPDMLKIIAEVLQAEGFVTSTDTNPISGLQRILNNPPDAVILDNRMPDMNGYQVCQELRKDYRTSNLPVIIVSVKNEETDVVVGLQVGADDYISKPIRRHELIARLNNTIMRRKGVSAPEPQLEFLQAGPLRLDFNKFNVMVDALSVELTPKEFDLLRFFISRQERVLTRDNISENVWGMEYVGTSRTIDVHVDQLRKKLAHYGHFIKTLKGIGYRFEIIMPLTIKTASNKKALKVEA